MPELPDVEVFKKYMDSTALHQNIEKVHVLDGAILGKVSPRTLQNHLKEREFTGTERQGKYIFGKTDADEWVVFHFGMTGFFKYYKDDSEQPGHTRVLIDFSNGYHLSYDCQRKLGLVDLIDDIQKFIEEKELGIDAFSDQMDKDRFFDLIKNRRGSIKSALMNQKLISGIGNVYSDEILFHAKFHPAAEIRNLSESDIGRIYNQMRKVLQTAIDSQVDPADMPSSFLLPNRDEDGECPICDGTIRKSTISGRSSYFCEKHQQKN
ncbi:hypothetical protein GF337_03570 [candidate division KSB1 bacterium]|nr:hypothetical protein [candidate division KSB1 bacterium]